jgi:hypothetical protein
MSFRDVSLKKTYDSDEDNILLEFLVPLLSKSIDYSRLVGFFSSTSLAVAARGIARLVANGGRMRIVASVRLSPQDVEAIQKAQAVPEELVANNIVKELSTLEDEFVSDHVRALGWMVANGILEIKVAVVLDQSGNPLDETQAYGRGIFHQKIGIMEDGDGNIVSFSGSARQPFRQSRSDQNLGEE